VPPFDDALVDLIAGQSDTQSGHMTIRELERARDGNLVAFLRALKERDWGAGKVLNAHDRTRAEAPGPVRITVPPSWIDYNGHVNESRYLQASSDTVDALLRAIGADMAYVRGGHSYYTAETHIRHLGEARVGDVIEGTARVLSHDAKRLHVWVSLTVAGREVATVEQMLLHVDMGAGKAVPAPRAILDAIAARNAGGPLPEGAGRFVGAPR
jgi:carnitine 3-dehydrogenase